MTYQLASGDHPGLPRRAPGPGEFAFRSVVGESPPIRTVMEFATKVARRQGLTVLLVGETGTGKGLFARGIHYASPASDEPFVAVNCAAIPGTLLESELFGHERGAFTDARSRKRGLLELAGGGALFLDEVSELPTDLQPKLLRALEERRFRRLGGLDEIEIRCRIIAATNTSLEEAVTAGHFREDLFYRLNVLRVIIPPLRDRKGDVELLARRFLDELASEQGFGPKSLSREALAALEAHAWPGNVRELRNVVQRSAVSADGPWIQAADIILDQRLADPPAVGGQVPVDPGTVVPAGGQITIPPQGKSLGEIEEEAVRMTLDLTGGNQSAAARILRISRPTLVRKMDKYGLRRA